MSLPVPNCIRCNGITFHVTKAGVVLPSPAKGLNIFFVVCSSCGGIAGIISDDPKKVKKA